MITSKCYYHIILGLGLGPCGSVVGGGLGVTVLDQAKSFWNVADDDGGLESAVSICFGCGLDDVEHVLIKLQPLGPSTSWGPLNPLLWNYHQGSGSVGRLLDGLLLHLTLPLQARISWGYLSVGLSIACLGFLLTADTGWGANPYGAAFLSRQLSRQ